MAIESTLSKNVYLGDGAATDFPFSFKVWETSQLQVQLASPDGVVSTASGWTATLSETGGTVRYLHQGAALPAGWKLAITRQMPFTQDVSLISGTRFDPKVIETALDTATAERQQLLKKLERAVVLDTTSSETPQELLDGIYARRDAATEAASTAQAQAQASADAALAAEASAQTCVYEVENAKAQVELAKTEVANAKAEVDRAKADLPDAASLGGRFKALETA